MHKFYSIVECNIKIFQTCIFIMIIHWLIYVVKNDLDTKVPCNLFYSHSNSALRVFHKLRHLHKNHICRCNLCCKNHQHILQKSVLNSIYQTSNEFLNNDFFLITNILQRWTQILLQNPKKKVKILKYLIHIKTYLELFGCPKRCLTNWISIFTL